MRQVAIIGQGPGCDSYPRDWETWGLSWAKNYGLTRYFEIHDVWRDCHKKYGNDGKGYYDENPVDVLNDLPNVYLPEEDNGIPRGERYPIEAVIAEVGNYLECSISFMLALAILERVPTIGLYGVSGDDGYSSQRPNIEYLIGFARGVGINVHIGAGSCLLRSSFPGGRYGLEENEHGY